MRQDPWAALRNCFRPRIGIGKTTTTSAKGVHKPRIAAPFKWCRILMTTTMIMNFARIWSSHCAWLQATSNDQKCCECTPSSDWTPLAKARPKWKFKISYSSYSRRCQLMTSLSLRMKAMKWADKSSNSRWIRRIVSLVVVMIRLICRIRRKGASIQN